MIQAAQQVYQGLLSPPHLRPLFFSWLAHFNPTVVQIVVESPFGDRELLTNFLYGQLLFAIETFGDDGTMLA